MPCRQKQHHQVHLGPNHPQSSSHKSYILLQTTPPKRLNWQLGSPGMRALALLLTLAALLASPAEGIRLEAIVSQVWQLTQLYPVCFPYEIIDFPVGQINDSSSGTILFYFIPSNDSLLSVSGPWRDFWADKAHCKCPQPRLMHSDCILELTTYIGISTPSGELSWPQTLLDIIKNNWRKPWWSFRFFTLNFNCKKANRI